MEGPGAMWAASAPPLSPGPWGTGSQAVPPVWPLGDRRMWGQEQHCLGSQLQGTVPFNSHSHPVTGASTLPT